MVKILQESPIKLINQIVKKLITVIEKRRHPNKCSMCNGFDPRMETFNFEAY